MTGDDDFDNLLPSLHELHEVIPVVREFPRIGGGRWIVASVEVWADAFIIRYAETGVEPTTEINIGPWSARDDVGTEYRGRGGSGIGGGDIRRGEREFVPPLNSTAKTLFVTWRSGELIEIPLGR